MREHNEATMHRRLLVAALACLTFCSAAQEARAQPRHKISAAQLHEALAKRFPVRFGAPGLLDLTITAPALLLLPERNKLGATLRVEGAGAQLPQSQSGDVDVAFSLRYEPSDLTLRAHELEVMDLRWAGASPESLRGLRRILTRIVPDAVGEVVLHKLTPRELALPEAMGLEPQKITVVADGLVIGFGPKPRR